MNIRRAEGCEDAHILDRRDMINDVEHIVVLQDDTDKKYFETLGASPGDVIVTDRCGRLAFQLQMPYSSIQFPYVKAAILSTFHDEPCGPCNIEFDPNMITGPQRIYQTLEELEGMTEASANLTGATTESVEDNLSFEAKKEANRTIEVDDIGNKTVSEEVIETSKEETSNGTEIYPATSVEPNPVVEDAKLSKSHELDDEEAVLIINTIENILLNSDNRTENIDEAIIGQEEGKEEINEERNITVKNELDLTETSGIKHGKVNITNLVNNERDKQIHLETDDNNNLDVVDNEDNDQEIEKVVDEDVANSSNSTSSTTNHEDNEVKSDEDKHEEELITETHTERILQDENKALETSTTVSEHVDDNKSDEEVFQTRIFTNEHKSKLPQSKTSSMEGVDESEESSEEIYQTHLFNKQEKVKKPNNENARHGNKESSTELVEEGDFSNEENQKRVETEEDGSNPKMEDGENTLVENVASTTEADELDYQIRTNKIKRGRSNSSESDTQYLFPITIIMRYPHLHRYKYKLRKHEYLVLETGKPSYHGHLEKIKKEDDSSEETETPEIKEYVDEGGVKYTKLIGNKYRDSFGNVIESVEETFSLKEYELSQEEGGSKKNKSKVIKGKEQLQHHYEKLLPWVRHIMEIQDTDAIDKSKLHRFGEKLKREHKKM